MAMAVFLHKRNSETLEHLFGNGRVLLRIRNKDPMNTRAPKVPSQIIFTDRNGQQQIHYLIPDNKIVANQQQIAEKTALLNPQMEESADKTAETNDYAATAKLLALHHPPEFFRHYLFEKYY